VVLLRELCAYMDNLLEISLFDDYAPNGLQVEGRTSVKYIVGGVTASLSLLEAARQRGADAVLVHHGYFWQGESPRVVGAKRRRMHCLLESGMSLIAYHLPLDAHPIFGNNAQLATVLGFETEGRFGPGQKLGYYGRLPEPMSGDALSEVIANALGRVPLYIDGNRGRKDIRTIAWCSGAAQDYIEDAARLGVDAYLSGEVSERTTHVAREEGIAFFAAGHHATERYGVAAMLCHLGEKFGVNYEFIDIDNPV